MVVIELAFEHGGERVTPWCRESAPGRLACTWIVGISTSGMSLTGGFWYATTPNNASAAISRLVAMGRRIKT